MNYKIKIDDQIFDVEVGNLTERPIRTKVNGESIEVWLESNSSSSSIQLKEETYASSVPQTDRISSIPTTKSLGTSPTQAAQTAISSDQQETGSYIKAPIPGVITAILVQPGAEVSVGQELCKLEAMKMNNSIRSIKAGKVSKVHVSIGEHVKHNAILFEFGR